MAVRLQGKTICILMIMINECMKADRKREMSVVAATFPMLRRGCVRDFKLILQGIGKWRDSRWNKTILKYTFQPGPQLNSFQLKTLIVFAVRVVDFYL